MNVFKVILKKLYIWGLIIFILCGCQKTSNIDVEQSAVSIPVIFGVNPQTGQADKKDFVDKFNEQNEGMYNLDVDWQRLSVEEYREKLKTLNVQDKLPAIISDAAIDQQFYEMLIENNRLINLEPYMDEEWKSWYKADILELCTEEDGSIYLSPIITPLYSFSGIYYNKEMLKKAGYETIPNDWDGFFECLNALKNKGYTPLSLHSGGTYWSPMLLSTAYLSRTEDGNEFLNELFPENYDTPEVREMFEFLKRIYDYTYDDALEIDYEAAQARFYNEEAAMLVNGYWILEAMTKEQQEMFGFAPFPDGIMMASPEMTAWAVTVGYDEDVTKGAVEAMRFRTMQSVKDSEMFMASEGSPLIQEYKDAVNKVSHVIPNYQLKWNGEIQNTFFDDYLPLYLNNEISLDDFIVQLSKFAKRNAD